MLAIPRAFQGLLAAIAGLLVLATAAVIDAREPTEQEQFFVELINRARLDPDDEAAAFGIDLNEGPPMLDMDPWTIDPRAVCGAQTNCFQPVAINPLLVDGAGDYAQELNDNDEFCHTCLGTDAEQRMSTAGYVAQPTDFVSGVARYTGDYGSSSPSNLVPGRENLAAAAETPPNGAIDDLTGTVEAQHGGLFVDAMVDGRGHRSTMMYGEFQEVGVGISTGMDTAGCGACDSIYIVTNFAHRSDRGPFLTGVAYDDLDEDAFYTPDSGEALAGLLVEAFAAGTMNLAGSTTTFSSGGYSIQLSVGIYDVRFSGMGHDQTFTFVPIVNSGPPPDMIGENTKLDYIVPEPSAALLQIAAAAAIAGLARRRRTR